MARSSMLAMAIAAAALLGLATAQPITNGTRFDGYTYVSNVIGYVNMTMDYCDIKAAVAAGNFATALNIYSMGKNSFAGLAKRTFYRFASYASTVGTVEPLHDALAMGRNATWLDSMIKSAFAKGDGPLVLGLIQVASLKYFFHEVDEGYIKVATYLNDTINNALLINDNVGAPHNVDEAFALWAGGSTKSCGTLSDWAAKLGGDLETTFVGKTYVNSAMTLALNEVLASSRLATLPLYNTTRFLVQRYITVLGLQGVMQSVFKAQAATGCKRSAAEIAEAKTMITVHWTYLEPLMVARKLTAANIKKVKDAAFAAKPNFASMLPSIKTVVTGLGLRMEEVGTPNFDIVTAGWKCKASVMKP